MDLAKIIRSALFFSSARRRLPCSVAARAHQDVDESFAKRVTSILSKPSLDSTKSKQILTQLSPSQFDHVFSAIKSPSLVMNPLTVLGFFKFGATSCRYRFSINSYCRLIHLLVASGLTSPARLLFKQLILEEIPVINPPSFLDRHIEVAKALVNLNDDNDETDKSVRVRTCDILVDVCCTHTQAGLGHTQPGLGLSLALEVLRVLGGHGVFPSLKTCRNLLTSLVKDDVLDIQRSYQAFEIIYRGWGWGLHQQPDVHVCSAAIKMFFNAGRFKHAVGLFFRMEKLGISLPPVIYNNMIKGLCNRGDLIGAFYFKDRVMLENKPNRVTYEILIESLCNVGKIDDARNLLEEMLHKGYVPTQVGFHSLIRGYCRVGMNREALKVIKLMLENIPSTSLLGVPKLCRKLNMI